MCVHVHLCVSESEFVCLIEEKLISNNVNNKEKTEEIERRNGEIKGEGERMREC